MLYVVILVRYYQIIQSVFSSHQMHQIQFWLGLCPRPRWGAYSAPQAPSWVANGQEMCRKG